MEREKIETYSVAYGVTEEGLGYIQISSFTALTAKQFSAAREELEKQNVKGLIIDLRDNLGGLVT